MRGLDIVIIVIAVAAVAAAYGLGTRIGRASGAGNVRDAEAQVGVARNRADLLQVRV